MCQSIWVVSGNAAGARVVFRPCDSPGAGRWRKTSAGMASEKPHAAILIWRSAFANWLFMVRENNNYEDQCQRNARTLMSIPGSDIGEAL
jgi:hypothetical protein